MAAKDPGDAYQLKIVLLDTEPPVWRRLLIPASLGLGRLHRAIQAAFGWEDDHGHVFRIRGAEYGESGSERAFDFRHERISLAGLGIQAGEIFHYAYGFEEGWDHAVTVEARLTPGHPFRSPQLLGGKRACPPEGSGGPFGFRDLLEAAGDPSHPEHGQALARFPTGWSAESCDLPSARARLAAAFPAR